MDLGGVLCAELATCRASFADGDAGPVSERTPDQIHDARVALRRIRSQLRTFRTAFDPTWHVDVRTEISWYEALLGQVRDCDVVAARLLSGGGRGLDRQAAATVTELLAAERAARLRPLAGAFGSPRHRSLLDSLDELASCPPLGPRSGRQAGPALLSHLERPWRDVREAARAARKAPTPDSLHLVRIRAKQLRYGAEIASTVLGPQMRSLAEACAALQSHLGRCRDADAAAAWLHGRIASTTGLGLELEQVASRQHDTAARLRDSWWPRYKAVRHAQKRSHVDSP